MADEQQKCNYLTEHLPYMLKMLRYTYQQMLQEQHYLSWNAHFESFGVHARGLVGFLTNTDKGNMQAKDFNVDPARIGDNAGLMTKLREQIFHLAKKRPTNLIAKFDTSNAKSILDWIEKNFVEFLAKLSQQSPQYRSLFNDKLADPSQDNAQYVTLGPTGPGSQSACTASPLPSQQATTTEPQFTIIDDRKTNAVKT
ncbi:MAG TPA: hypothetical protein VK749_12050 [Xanthobacteraceae bacterium]|nr:hypothetical protein [Xanthobacteraceae bacterium]